MDGERLLCGRVEWEACGQVKSRKMQRTGHRWRCGAGGGDETTIKFAVLMRADTIHGVEGAAAVNDQDRLAVRPGEACRPVGEFGGRKESFLRHLGRLRRGGGGR